MLRLNKKIKNEIFPVTFDDFEEGEGGRGGGGRGEGSLDQRQFLVFEHTKISESAQRNRIFSKPLSRVM